MSNTNIAVTNAINSLNEAAAKRAEADAASLIHQISDKLALVADNNSNITALQVELKRLESDTVDFTSVVGQTPGSTANTETIVKVIADLNKARQGGVQCSSTRIGSRILELQDANKAHNKALSDLREKLSKVAIKTVTEETIVG
jgi:hypothetical protein